MVSAVATTLEVEETMQRSPLSQLTSSPVAHVSNCRSEHMQGRHRHGACSVLRADQHEASHRTDIPVCDAEEPCMQPDVQNSLEGTPLKTSGLDDTQCVML